MREPTEAAGRPRTVRLCRSRIGFGFTITGQAPCLLSCIVPASPADAAGLRPGDSLVAVNGNSVRQLRHEEVAAIISRCGSELRLQIMPAQAVGNSDDDGCGGQRDIRQPPACALKDSEHFVVTYVGSASIPADAGVSSGALDAAVRRLKSERRRGQPALLLLTDPAPAIVACDGAAAAQLDGLAYAGPYAQDGRYFGVLLRPRRRQWTAHVFCVGGRRLSEHSAHAQWAAAAFGVECRPDGAGGCRQFPRHSAPVVAGLRSLCRPAPPDQWPQPVGPESKVAEFKVPEPPGRRQQAPRDQPLAPPPTPPSTPTPTPPDASPLKASQLQQGGSLLRRFARGASGSFRKLRRSVAMSTESLASSASDTQQLQQELDADDEEEVEDQEEEEEEEADECELCPGQRQRRRQAEAEEATLAERSCGKLNGSLAASERNLSVCAEPAASSVARWATGFDHLLGDPAGVRAFTAFLRLEFSEENIAFWLAVQHFKQLTDPEQASAAADRIVQEFIGSEAASSVNLDSCTVASVAASVRSQRPPPADVFDAAQKHIHSLMRMDSYSRFLKSQLYKDWLLSELEAKPSPSASGAGGSCESVADNDDSALRGARSATSLSGRAPPDKKHRGFLASLIRSRGAKRQSRGSAAPADTCCVQLPDGNTATVAADGQSGRRPLREALQQLCDSRGLRLSAVEVFVSGPEAPGETPLDLDTVVGRFAGRRLLLQQRVLFRVQLPCCRCLAVRARPDRSLAEVLRPLCSRYGLRLSQLVLCRSDDVDSPLSPDSGVARLQDALLLLVLKEDFVDCARYRRRSRSAFRPQRPSLASC